MPDRQLRLVDDDFEPLPDDTKLDPITKQVGKEGVAKAREILRNRGRVFPAALRKPDA